MDLIELWSIPGEPDTQTDQVLYNLARRSPEFDLLPWCREQGLPVMAALAWVIRHELVCAIPKSGSRAHVAENAAALAVRLDATDQLELDLAFPPPQRARPLEMH
jgi:diketogulonate reductase-like aldo/keto reductase